MLIRKYNLFFNQTMAGNSSAKNKRQEEKYVQMIRDLASLPMNKQCFDCNSKGPTYVE